MDAKINEINEIHNNFKHPTTNTTDDKQIETLLSQIKYG
jgi:hypothetical protein